MTLPHSPETEEALLARLLVDPAQIAVLSGTLHAEDFYVEAYRNAYRAMQALTSRAMAVDLTTLQRELGSAAPIEIATLTSAHRAPVEDYARIIGRDAFRRRLIGALDGVMRKAYVEEDRQKLLGDLQEAVSSVLQGVEDGRLLSPDQAVDSYLNTLAGRHQGLGLGLTYGFRALDEFLQPAQPGEMIVLAARPSVGKTAMAEQIADHWATFGRPVLFVSLEMSLGQLIDRSIARKHGGRITRGHINDEQYALAKTTAEARRSVMVWYLDDPFATTPSVRAAAAKVRLLAGGLGAIIVDYISLLKDPGDSEVQRVTRISRNIKAIAREFDVPVLALSQLNRAVMHRDDQHPKLHDLRESGAIEQDADVVIGLHRELGTPDLSTEVLKNRHGLVRRVELYFDPDAMLMR